MHGMSYDTTRYDKLAFTVDGDDCGYVLLPKAPTDGQRAAYDRAAREVRELRTCGDLRIVYTVNGQSRTIAADAAAAMLAGRAV